MGCTDGHMSAAVLVSHSARSRRRLADRRELCIVQHRPEDSRVQTRLTNAHKNIPGPPERSKRHQMGSPGTPTSLVLRRHDS